AICYPALLIPVLIAAGVIWIHMRDLSLSSQRWIGDNSIWEIAGIAVPGVAFLIALIRWGISKRPYWLWLAGLAGIFCCREMHFFGTNLLVYTAPLLLLAVAWLRFDALADFLTNPTVITMIVMIGIFYSITQSLDARLFSFLPDERKWERGAEESLEVVGHLMWVA
ncbi:MAG: hypothetical protein GY869_22390, partial [Planctomycetes bacterium]|nr:hypothetical protein [Planctomycetota bacterium]